MGKSSRHISDSNSDVSDDLSLQGVSLRITELENAICDQDKMLCKAFHENKKLNHELKSASSEITSLRSVHDDMSAKPCDNCKMKWLTMRICGSCILMLQVCLIVQSWN
jgi:hypothetical protein